MKKSLFLFILIILGIFFTGISIYAEDGKITLNQDIKESYILETVSSNTTYNSNINSYDNFLQSYYDNLTYNLGMNYQGSCGYVAIGMLLSYYDAYLCDDIIDDSYDIVSIGNDANMISRRNSPGIMKDIISNPNMPELATYGSLLSPTDYYNHMASLSNVSFHSKLITIGAELGYYNFYAQDKNPAALSFDEIRLVLTNYLNSKSQLNFNIEIMSPSNDSDIIRSYTIDMVKRGVPVLLSIEGINGGHAVIAYDYDEISDNLYCHMGWGANKTHVTIESENFYSYTAALSVNFNLLHSHSNNYGIIEIINNVPNTYFYCCNDSNIILYNHSHSYNFKIMKNDENSHIRCCSCGENFTENHTFIDNVCSICSHVHVHSYTKYGKYSLTQHKKICSGCDDYILQYHIINGQGSGKCILCGFPASSSGSINPFSINSINYITENGSYIAENGVIVLSDIDYLKFLSGSLDVYALVEDL